MEYATDGRQADILHRHTTNGVAHLCDISLTSFLNSDA